MTIAEKEKQRQLYYLTPRERTIIVTLANTAGTDAQIAAALGLRRGTVKVYMSRMRDKISSLGFDVKSRYNLITWAKEHKAELEAA